MSEREHGLLAVKIPGRPLARLGKSYTTVGRGAGYDVSVSEKGDEILFALQRDERGISIIPGSVPLALNGRRIRKLPPLRSCDRIEWKDGGAVLGEDGAPADRAPVGHLVMET